MGYCMILMYSEFHIAAEDVPKALKAIQEMESRVSDRGSGFTAQGGHVVSRNYAWVSEGFSKIKSFDRIMEEWRWEAVMDDDGNVDEIQFLGEKLGDDEQLFEAIAPYVKAGSYIEMEGEDGSRWQWTFDGKQMVGKSMETHAVGESPADERLVQLRTEAEKIVRDLRNKGESFTPEKLADLLEKAIQESWG